MLKKGFRKLRLSVKTGLGSLYNSINFQLDINPKSFDFVMNMMRGLITDFDINKSNGDVKIIGIFG